MGPTFKRGPQVPAFAVEICKYAFSALCITEQHKTEASVFNPFSDHLSLYPDEPMATHFEVNETSVCDHHKQTSTNHNVQSMHPVNEQGPHHHSYKPHAVWETDRLKPFGHRWIVRSLQSLVFHKSIVSKHSMVSLLTGFCFCISKMYLHVISLSQTNKGIKAGKGLNMGHRTGVFFTQIPPPR